MFDGHSRFKRYRLVSIGRCVPHVFRPSLDGSVNLSEDYTVEASNPLDFQLDNLIASRVPLSAGPQTESLDLNSMDNVEHAAMRILESEQYVKTDNTEFKNN